MNKINVAHLFFLLKLFLFVFGSRKINFKQNLIIHFLELIKKLYF